MTTALSVSGLNWLNQMTTSPPLTSSPLLKTVLGSPCFVCRYTSMILYICMFVESIHSLNHVCFCPFIDDLPKPILGPFKMATPEKPFTTTCSVRHTCPSRMPKLTWSKGTMEEITEIHKDLSAGMWETQSILTFIPQEKDDGTELTCSALFSGGKQSHTSLTLNVKRTCSLF